MDETLFRASNEPEESEEEKCNENLNRKLQEEMNYHQTGSRMDNIANPSNTDPLSVLRSRKVFNEPCLTYTPNPGNFVPHNGPHNPEQASPMHPDLYEQPPEAYTPYFNQTEYALPNEQQRMLNAYHLPMAPTTPEPRAYLYEQSLHGFGPQNFYKTPVAESAVPSYYPQHANQAYASNVNYIGGESVFSFPFRAFPLLVLVNNKHFSCNSVSCAKRNANVAKASPKIQLASRCCPKPEQTWQSDVLISLAADFKKNPKKHIIYITIKI